MSLTQYQRSLVLLTRLGYKQEHIAHFQGMVDAILEDYDELLRLVFQRIAVTSQAIEKLSMTEGLSGFKATRIVDRNDELLETGLEFLARKHFERIPFDELGLIPFEAQFDAPDLLRHASRQPPTPVAGTGIGADGFKPPKFRATKGRRIQASDTRSRE
jgi:hypothetical protein